MKLFDLDPHWWASDVDTGLSFQCPHCRTQRLAVAMDTPTQALMRTLHKDAIQLTHVDGKHWHREGETFDVITLSPSIDASAHGHWHGFIRNGDVV